MIIHNLNRFPEGADYSYFELYELSPFDLENLAGRGIDEMWYWYGVGSYEGCGWALMRQGDTYDLHDMGHCSCYGALDHLDLAWQPPEVIRERYSSEALREIADLLKEARL